MAAVTHAGAGGGEPLQVYVSVSGPDRAWARWIAQELRRAGHVVEYDEWSWQPGTTLPDDPRAAFAAVDKVVAVVSPAYFDPSTPGWEEREAAASLTRDRPGVFVPVLIAPTAMPSLLGRLAHVSLVGLPPDEARDRLLRGLRPSRPPGLDEDMPWPGDRTVIPVGRTGSSPSPSPAPLGASPTPLGPAPASTSVPTVFGDAPFPDRDDQLARRVAAALPDYEVTQRLGAGTFGVVFAASHRKLGRATAVKVLSADREEPDSQFGSEARVLAGLDRHPHVVTIYDYVERDGLQLIVMELLTGQTLTARRSTLTPADACAVGLAVAEALSHVHERGVLHRDIKPDNMLFDASGQLKVTDFGIAKIFDGTAASASQVIGTPRYMAPEQISGHRLGPSTDLYALAVILYELLGEQPLHDEGMPLAAMFHRQLNVVPPPPKGVPAPLADVVMRSLAKDPAKRYPSAHAFALDLAAAAASSYGPGSISASSVRTQLSDDVRAAASPWPPPPVEPRPSRTRRLFVKLGLVVAAAAVAGGLGVVLWPDQSSAGQVLGDCGYVSIETGQEGSPYYRYGTVLADLVHASYPGTTAVVQPTTGSAYNLESVRTPAAARCVLSVVQFTTAVDARFGVLQFQQSPIDTVRSVGPIWFDLLQLVVRDDGGIHGAADLCGRRVATGLPQSGTFQIGEVLFRQVGRDPGQPGCEPDLLPGTLAEGLDDLRAGTVDAVLWAGGSPTQEIRDAVDGGLAIRLLPLDGYVRAMQSEWDAFYGQRLGTNFASGPVYGVATVEPADYGTAAGIATVAVPNGLVVNDVADPKLVEFVTRSLFDRRSEFEAVLWPADEASRAFPTAQQAVGTNPVYCLVPLHPAAAGYYQSVGVAPPCPPP